MPLFFVISGFFTTMLWQRQGTKALIRHRLRRVGLPFALSVVTILPLLVAAQLAATKLAATKLAGTLPLAPGAVETAPTPWFPIAHLWFLWFLLLMVAGFAMVVTAAAQLEGTRAAIVLRWLRSLPVAGTLLMITAIAAQSRMEQDLFGPDTSEGLMPIPRTFVVYACFFAWGAMIFGRTDPAGRPIITLMGRWWGASLVIAAGLFLVGASALGTSHEGRVGTVGGAVQVAYAVAAGCGLIGLFGRWFSSDRTGVRWLSDSSYWLYLTHLPLVLLGQGLVIRWGLPPLVGFALIVGSVTSLLLVSYRYLVRHTPIGTMLNGPRARIDIRTAG